MVDALDSKSSFFGSMGSSPIIGISLFYKGLSVVRALFASSVLAFY